MQNTTAQTPCDVVAQDNSRQMLFSGIASALAGIATWFMTDAKTDNRLVLVGGAVLGTAAVSYGGMKVTGLGATADDATKQACKLAEDAKVKVATDTVTIADFSYEHRM